MGEEDARTDGRAGDWAGAWPRHRRTAPWRRRWRRSGRSRTYGRLKSAALDGGCDSVPSRSVWWMAKGEEEEKGGSQCSSGKSIV